MDNDAMGSRLALVLAASLLAAACGRSPGPTPAGPASSAASPHTAAENRKVAESLPVEEMQDFEDARRGFIATDDPLVIKGADGRVVWDFQSYAFIDGPAPSSVNPSLWRQAKLNGYHGLFEVVPGIHQVRGYDTSNMTLIDGRTGWILVDPLTTAETAAAALALARKHLGDRPISAVIFTHSHGDHFGGIDGVLPKGPGTADVPILAPEGFTEEATSENVLAGMAMARRTHNFWGVPLVRDATGGVDGGLGKGSPIGSIGFRMPTVVVDHTPQEMEVDGVKFVFQNAPQSEAPAELTFYLPGFRAWCGAEIVSHTMHNLLTLRGAKVRDAAKWSGYIDEAMRLFGGMEVVFASHHWPVWGNARALDYLAAQRDVYRYIHDQTLRLANDGYTPREIAERLELPRTLRARFANRGYYGTVRHNAKAVYQFYFGWYDGNPANLDPLPPEEEGAKYVAALGGADQVIVLARAAHEAGEDRWAATLLNHLVFADPANRAARVLLAAVYDQLGFRAESGVWRNIYLTGAYELRTGKRGSLAQEPARFAALLAATPVDRFLDSMAVRLNGEDADGKRYTFNFVFTDVGETHVLEVENAVLHHRRADPVPDADATVRLTRDLLVQLGTGQAGLKDLVMSDALQVDGSRLKLLGFLSLLDTPDPTFPIVTP
jgi:alkyl sulfatase BDS1-like metallo-beta-lactamase superfamily hydrolase